MRLAGVARGDRKMRHRADGGQRLAAKPQRIDGEEVFAVELRGRVALDREHQVGLCHAHAVVGDADQAAAAAVSRDVDVRRPGVECVLDKLLNGARRAFDHFPGSDAVDDRFR